jgi:hypothetical protein
LPHGRNLCQTGFRTRGTQGFRGDTRDWGALNPRNAAMSVESCSKMNWWPSKLSFRQISFATIQTLFKNKATHSCVDKAGPLSLFAFTDRSQSGNNKNRLLPFGDTSVRAWPGRESNFRSAIQFASVYSPGFQIGTPIVRSKLSP